MPPDRPWRQAVLRQMLAWRGLLDRTPAMLTRPRPSPRRVKGLIADLRAGKLDDAWFASDWQGRIRAMHQDLPPVELLELAVLAGKREDAAVWLAWAEELVELARLANLNRPFAELVRWLVQQRRPRPPLPRNHAEADGLAALAIRALDSGLPAARPIVTDVLAGLVATHPRAVQRWQGRLLQHGILRPGRLYVGASPAIRQVLLNRLRAHPNDALVALAFAAGAGTARQLAAWDLARPDWAKKLHVSPLRYAHEGGWDGTGGKVRPLITSSAVPLVPGRGGRLMVLDRERCGHCQAPLVIPVDLPGVPRASWCEGCYGTTFTHQARWLPSSQKVLDGDRTFRPRSRAIAKGQPAPATRPLGDWGTTRAFLGGHPAWLQDAQYPACPGCARTMPCFAQLDLDRFGSNGMLYAFHCAACRIAACLPQCT